jgi:hypothetical protein
MRRLGCDGDKAECPWTPDSVGYRVPLFLGGKDVVGNLKVTDLEVYRSLSSQLRGATRNLPPGSAIGGVQRA